MKSEETTQDTPRVYVASLSDYNAGRCLGEWFDLEAYEGSDELLEAITAMLRRFDQQYPPDWGVPREEHACHDWEHVPDRFCHESTDFERLYEYLATVGPMDEEQREAYELFVNNGDDPEHFDDRYQGRYGDAHWDDARTMENYAEQMFWETHDEESVPKELHNYIDFMAMGRDILLSGDCWCSDGFVFTTR